MTDIKKLAEKAYEETMNQTMRPQDRAHVTAVCERFLAAYLSEQEPVGWFDAQHHDFSRVERIGWKPLFTAPQQKKEYAWECNECGSQEYIMSVSEYDVNNLGCGKCGGGEWHKAEIES